MGITYLWLTLYRLGLSTFSPKNFLQHFFFQIGLFADYAMTTMLSAYGVFYYHSIVNKILFESCCFRCLDVTLIYG